MQFFQAALTYPTNWYRAFASYHNNKIAKAKAFRWIVKDIASLMLFSAYNFGGMNITDDLALPFNVGVLKQLAAI
jgi:hypothetical protein